MWGPEPPGDTGVTGCQLQVILKAQEYWARLPTRAPLWGGSSLTDGRTGSSGLEGLGCSGPRNSRGARAAVLWSPSQHSVTWDLPSTAIMLDPRDRLPGGERDCDMFLLLLNPLCYSPSLRE